MQHYIVNYSTGLASTEALERTIEQKGKENTTAVFADVKGHSTEEHTGEDEDSYRFMADVESYFDIKILRIVEGRDIWQVMFDERAITLPVGKTRVAKCSIKLKREPIDRWIVEHFTPDECVQVTGLGWNEAHRIADFEAARAPYKTWHPLNERPFMDNCHIEAKWAARGIPVPRLYVDGFSHGNCGGFCVKAGLAHFARLYFTNRPRYLFHAEKEKRFRTEINEKATILRLRRGGKVTPITLYDFAAMLDRGEDYDRDDWGGVRVLLARTTDADGRYVTRSGCAMSREPCPMTRPLSDVGYLNKELRAGRITLSAYMRQIGNDGGAGRRILVSWRGTARAWLNGEGR